MTPARRRALLAIGFGEFVDGYDLIVISGALLQLQPHFGLDKGEVGWVSAAAFFGSAVGALLLGGLADRIGRRRVFVLNLVAFVGLALLSAAISQVWMLYAVRALIGVAIGADIVASMAFLAELSPRASRGKWAGAMPQITWSLGAICAILLAAGLYELIGAGAWRVMFAAGALPAVVVLLLRRSLPDSPRWLLARGRVEEAIGSFEQFGLHVVDPVRLGEPAPAPRAAGTEPGFRGWVAPYARLFSGRSGAAVLFAVLMIGLMPLNGIGQSVLTPYVLREFGRLSAVNALLGGAVLWVGAIVGSCVALMWVDRLGRIVSLVVSLVGFIGVYLLMVTVAAGTWTLVPLFCLLGVVTWFGASACWPLPSELAPTAVRGRAQGLGSALQRVSLGVNVLVIPSLLSLIGFRPTVLLAAGISALLVPLALWGRRYEPSGRSIELASRDELFSEALAAGGRPGTGPALIGSKASL